MLKSQNDKILQYLQKGNKITTLEASYMFGCLRLSGRIYDLRQKGYIINSQMVVRSGKRVSEYSLIKKGG